MDLSQATKLKDVALRPGPRKAEWIITALQTITPKHRDLRQISIHMPYQIFIGSQESIAGARFGKWSDLDCLLVQLWELYSIRPKLMPMDTQSAGDQTRLLFPEVTKRGIIDNPEILYRS
jgi:hypothetical protein